jgi:hypothetical protein
VAARQEADLREMDEERKEAYDALIVTVEEEKKAYEDLLVELTEWETLRNNTEDEDEWAMLNDKVHEL